MAGSTKKAAKKQTQPKGKTITSHDGKPINIEGGGIVAVIDLGREALMLRVNEFKKRRYFDIRRFYLSDQDEWKPSSKGVAIPAESAQKFFAILEDQAGRISLLLAGEDA